MKTTDNMSQVIQTERGLRAAPRVIAISMPFLALYVLVSLYIGIFSESERQVINEKMKALQDFATTTTSTRGTQADRQVHHKSLDNPIHVSERDKSIYSNHRTSIESKGINYSFSKGANEVSKVGDDEKLLEDRKRDKKNRLTLKASNASSSQLEQYSYPGRLKCEKWGGPSIEVAKEMVYWKKIPYDSTIISPLTHPHETQYLTFEVDEGGWNNVRMAFETVVAIAIASGRTLVLPPKLKIWGVVDNDKVMGFEDFFPLHATGLKLISFQDFLENEALNGNIVDSKTGKPSFPPENRTNWNGMLANYESVRYGHGQILYGWLRNVTKPWRCGADYTVGAFPATRGPKGTQRIRSMLHNILETEKIEQTTWSDRVQSFSNKPTPVNASAEARLREMLADRKKVCVYDPSYQNAKVVHIYGEQNSGYRMLVHFYAFVFIEDYILDLHTKRFIRDQLRYKDELQCAASRIVHKVRQNAIQNGSPDGSFDTFHIRRADFEDFYNDVFMTADDIYRNNTSAMIREKRTVYVATDEKDMTFFLPLREHYNLLFLNDFLSEIPDILPNFYGLLDQIVAARGDAFVGTLYSTFSGYINRLRGYFSNTTDGSTLSYYLAPDSLMSYRNIMTMYSSVVAQYWIREFPVCWRDIDHGLIHTTI